MSSASTPMFAAPKLLVATVCAVFASGCATTQSIGSSVQETFASDDPCANNARNVGIAVGTIAGLVIGNQFKHSTTSRLLGAAAGAAIGGFIGADIDRRRCELYKIAKANKIDIAVEEIKTQPAPTSSASSGAENAKPQSVGLRVALRDNGRQFKSGSDELTPEALAYFQQIADQYSYQAQKSRLTALSSKDEVAAVETLKTKRIVLIGHTDDTGNSSLNADLSERRAHNVAKVFRDRGISDAQLFYQGAGEVLPVADNRSEEGRARTRRVEIVDLTDDVALQEFLSNRMPKIAYYRNTLENPPSAPSASESVASGSTTAPKNNTKRATLTSVAGTKSAKTAKDAEKPVVAPSIDGVESKPTPVVTPGPQIDFGGAPVGGRVASVDIGKPVSASSSFSIISSAQADESVVGSCLQDRPRVSKGVKSLADGKDIPVRDYLPGLYGTSWAGMANGHLVAVTNVAVLRDGALPAGNPHLMVFQDYKGNRGAKPTIDVTPTANAYRGDKGVLYRVFVNGPVQCIDLVIPNTRPGEAPESKIYYARDKAMYLATFNPTLAKN